MRHFIFAAAAASLLTAMPANAAENLVVPYKDLDLSTAKGQKALDRRIISAARKFCGIGEQATGTHMPDSSARACVADARKAAREQVATLTGQQLPNS